MWYHDFYPKSQPKAVKGGIKAQSKSGAFGQTWWAKRRPEGAGRQLEK